MPHEEVLTFLISLLLLSLSMICPIDLNDKTIITAYKIHNIISYYMLP